MRVGCEGIERGLAALRPRPPLAAATARLRPPPGSLLAQPEPTPLPTHPRSLTLTHLSPHTHTHTHTYPALWLSTYLVKQVSTRTRVLVLLDVLKTRVFGRDTSLF